MLSVENKRKLEVNRPELMKGIDLEDGLLFAELRKREVITPDREDTIRVPGGNSAKVGKLLDSLLRGDSDTLDHFIESLKATGSGHKALAAKCFGAGFRAIPPLHVANTQHAHAYKLAGDRSARNEFLDALKQKSESMKPRASLYKVVRLLKIDPKVLVYLIQLVPDVSEQIGRLFIIERAEDEHGCPYKPINFLYYKELVDAVTDVQPNNVLIQALVNAEVYVPLCAGRDADEDGDDMAWFDLFKHLDKDQSATLLRKTHGFKLCVDDHQSTLSFSVGNRTLVANEFILAVAYRFDCSIITDNLLVNSPDLDLPVCMLSRNMSRVRVLQLSGCTLCENIPYRYSRHEGLNHQQPDSAESALESVEMSDVKGMAHLQHCNTVTSRPCHLQISSCDNVTVRDLKRCFPEIRKLGIEYTTVLQPGNEVGSNTPVAKKMAEICPLIQEFDNSLDRLYVTEYQFLERANLPVQQRFEIEVREITTRNDILLCEISLICASVPIGELLDACRPAPQCRKVKAEHCDIQFNVGDTLQTRYDSLEELEMIQPSQPVDLAQILSFCSRSQLKVVHIDTSTLLIDDEKMNTIQQMPELEATFRFRNVSVSKPDRKAWNSGRTDALAELLREKFPSGEVDIGG